MNRSTTNPLVNRPKSTSLRPLAQPSNVDSETTSVLEVKEMNLCFNENGSNHHTDLFELMDEKRTPRHLVVRRGEPFQLILTLNRTYDPETDTMSFIFILDEAVRPSVGNGTFVTIPVQTTPPDDNMFWSAVVTSTEQVSVTVNVTPPANCIVGVWNVEVDTMFKPTEQALCYTPESQVYILFNAWCKEDQVYNEGENERKEYVSSSAGYLYIKAKPFRWDYRQYSKDILDISIYLMTKIGKVPLIQCNNPVKVTRALSAAVNSNNDHGVLFGLWPKDDSFFSDGKEPWKWGNSKEILSLYYDNEQRAVKYGQCWVFAGVLTTVCRALGIPCRPVTTLNSAHDTKGSLTIDAVYDDQLTLMHHMSDDSCWDFHVWNEVWTKRPDLEPGDYDGWNVIDATPQEDSDGLKRCGPASVKAIQRGEVLKPFDTEFLFGETNAEEFFWKYTGPTSPPKPLFTYRGSIANRILTKALGFWDVEDITKNYRYEGVKRIAYFPGTIPSFKDKPSNSDNLKDIKVEIKHPKDIIIGSPFSVTAVVTNNSQEKDFNVALTLRVDATTYTGKHSELVKIYEQKVVVDKGTSPEIVFDVTFEDYFSKLVDQNDLNIKCLAKVEETGFECLDTSSVQILTPIVNLKVPTCWVNKPATIYAYLTNPLPEPLTNCWFFFDGLGLDQENGIELEGPISKYESGRVEFTVTPKRSGPAILTARFQSKELNNARGSYFLTVNE